MPDLDLSWWKCGTCLFYDGNEREGVCRFEPSKFPRVRVQANERGCSEHVEVTSCVKCGKPMDMGYSLVREPRSCWECLDAEDEMRRVAAENVAADVEPVAEQPAAGAEEPSAPKPRGRRKA